MIMLPFAVRGAVDSAYYIFFVANIIIHAIVDDAKANRFKINLWEDQLIHMFQIAITCLALGGF
jgi:hypothetical protein